MRYDTDGRVLPSYYYYCYCCCSLMRAIFSPSPLVVYLPSTLCVFLPLSAFAASATIYLPSYFRTPFLSGPFVHIPLPTHFRPLGLSGQIQYCRVCYPPYGLR